MNLAEITAEVILLTNRPDLAARTDSAIKAATLKCHSYDFWNKDIVETALSFGSPAFEQSFDTIATFPRWKALKYLRPVADGSTTPMRPSLVVITPAEILDGYGYEKQNVCYEAGQIIQIKTDTEYDLFALGYYSHPDLTLASLGSWIARSYPWAIIYEAAAIVLKSIGQADMEASMRALSLEQKQQLMQNNVLLEGY